MMAGKKVHHSVVFVGTLPSSSLKQASALPTDPMCVQC